MEDSTVNIRSYPKPIPFSVMEAYTTERFLTLMSGGHARGNFTLKLLDNSEDGLNFRCPDSDEKIVRDKTLAFQMLASEEK